MINHEDFATAVQQWEVGETSWRFCDERYDHAELCECMQGFYSNHCSSMLKVSKTYFTDVNLVPLRNLYLLVSQAGYKPVFIP